MIRAIIIEDEIDAQDLLCKLIEDYITDVEVIGIASDLTTATKLIRDKTPDLLFLDIRLGNDNSFDLFKEIDLSGIDVIFITAYDHRAIDAFKVDAVDYILKPFSPKELFVAVEKVKNRKNNSKMLQQIKNVLDVVQQTGKKRIALPTSIGIKYVNEDKIIRVEADRSYCTVHILDDDAICISKPLKDIEEKLSEKLFLRVHASHLIHNGFIKEFVKEDGGYLTMVDGSNIPISRRKKQEVLRIIS